MKFCANKILLGFKPRPKDVIPWEVDDKYKTHTGFNIPENQGEIEGHPFKFNIATGMPEDIFESSQKLANGLAGRPLTFAEHAKDQAVLKGVDFDTELAHLKNSFPLPEHGFSPVETEIVKDSKGSRISKLVMRGPRANKPDVVMPVNTMDTNRLLVPTVWPNKTDDNHDTLDMRRIHLPEEYAHGKSPTRRLISPDEARQPGYQPISLNNQKALAEIRRKHGIPKLQDN